MLRSMMLALVESVGDEVDPESRIFWPHVIDDSIEPSSSTRNFAHRCIQTKLLHRPSDDKYSTENEDDDNDDDDGDWEENHHDY